LIKFDDNGQICPIEKNSSTTEIEGLEVTLYPNPVSEILYLNVTEPLSSLMITDNNGRTITQRATVHSGTILFLPVMDYNSGQYYIHFTTKDGRQATEPFVVVR